MRTLILLVALTLFAAPLSDVDAQTSCGLKPLKPLVPIECRDLILQCLCDRNGQNCGWTWVCVPKKR
jgi:hypothetical protein